MEAAPAHLAQPLQQRLLRGARPPASGLAALPLVAGRRPARRERAHPGRRPRAARPRRRCDLRHRPGHGRKSAGMAPDQIPKTRLRLAAHQSGGHLLPGQRRPPARRPRKVGHRRSPPLCPPAPHRAPGRHPRFWSFANLALLPMRGADFLVRGRYAARIDWRKGQRSAKTTASSPCDAPRTKTPAAS